MSKLDDLVSSIENHAEAYHEALSFTSYIIELLRGSREKLVELRGLYEHRIDPVDIGTVNDLDNLLYVIDECIGEDDE
jgi:hypothetical protein